MEQPLQLKRSISWPQGAALTVGAVLGSGILVLPAITANLAGPAALISWLAMGLLSLPMIIVISIMSSHFPDAGGIAAYVRQGIGPQAGHITGALMLTAMPFGMPVTALIGAHYLGSIFGWSQAAIHLAAAGLLITAIVLNYRGIDLSGRTQIGVVTAILFILVLAIGSAVSAVQPAAFLPFTPHGWFSVGSAMPIIFFAYIGWEMIGNLAEEFKNPRKNIPLSLGIAAVLVNLLYLAVTFVTIGTGVYLSSSPMTAMVTLIAYRFGETAGIWIALLGFLICYCPIHTFVAGFSRLVYSQARTGFFPSCFGHLHPRYQTPHIALLTFIPIYCIILFLSDIFSWDVKFLINLPCANFLMVYTWGMIAAAKILTGKITKACAVLSASLCGIVLLFSGWVLLYPLGIIVLMLCRFLVSSRPSMKNSK